jgi:hypothetical protein
MGMLSVLRSVKEIPNVDTLVNTNALSAKKATKIVLRKERKPWEGVVIP